MPDYGIVRNFIAITPSGIVAIPSGSKTNPESAISASVPQILAVTCSSNFNNRLTKLTTLNAFGTITLASGSSNFRDTRIILRYIDSSSFGSEEPGIFRKENPINEDDSAIDLRFSGSKINDTFIDIPLNNNDDSFLVAYRTVEALKTSKVFNKSFNVSLVDDGSSLSIISASLGNTMKIGSSFKIRNSASLGTNNLTDGAEGKFIITSLNSGSVALPDFSGTATQVGGMQIGSSFKIGSTEPVFQFNIIQAGSGKTNQRFYPGRVSVASASLVQRIDPDDNKSFEFLVPSQSIGGDDDLAALYVSSSRRIGFATKDPLTDVDIRADEFQVQRKTERRGLRINTEGNIESFDKNAATATTGSEFILNFSRGISITPRFLAAVGFVGAFTGSSDAAALEIFNSLKPDRQAVILDKGERIGFIQPPQQGDTLGQIRWVSESGSIGDFDKRTTGETAVIKAVVSSVAGDGVQADLIFSVADKTGAAVQKFLIDAGNEHQVTGSLNVNGSVAIAGFLQSKDNPNTRIDFDAGSGDVNIELQPNGNKMMILSNGGSISNATGQYGVLINQNHENADFRIDGDDAFKGDFSLFFDASGDGGRGQLYLGGETLADFQGISPVVNAKLHVSGNIFADGTKGHITASGNISSSGTIFANKIVTTEVTSSFITSSTSILIQNFTSSGDSDFKGNITSSGNISASGIITALSSNIVTINGGSF